MDSKKIVIIGGGIAGSAFAVYMAGKNHNITILDASKTLEVTYASGTPFTHTLGKDLITNLFGRKQIEVWIKDGSIMPVAGMDMHLPYGKWSSIRGGIPQINVNGEVGYFCPTRPWIDNQARRLAYNLLGKDRFKLDTKVIKVFDRGDCVHIQTDSGIIECDIAVLASGRPLLNSDNENKDYFFESRSGLFGYIEVDFDLSSTNIFWKAINGEVYFFFPTGKHTACLVYATPDDSSFGVITDTSGLISLFKDIDGLNNQILIGAKATSILVKLPSSQHRLHFNPDTGSNRIFKIGDSAAHATPIFGMGIQWSLLSALKLAKLLQDKTINEQEMRDKYISWWNNNLKPLFDVFLITQKPYSWDNEPFERLLQRMITAQPKMGDVLIATFNGLLSPNKMIYFTNLAKAFILGDKMKIPTKPLVQS